MGGLERWTGDRVVLTEFEPRCGSLASEPFPFTPLCQCLSEETLKAGTFYLVSMPGTVKDPTLSWTPHSSLEKDNSLHHSCVSPNMGCLEYT